MTSSGLSAEGFYQYLVETGKTARTAEQYVKAVQHALAVAAGNEDLLEQEQNLVYLRWALRGSYQTVFGSVWSSFVRFCRTQDIDLPDLPELRRIKLVHPISGDLFTLLGKFYNGIPETLTWAEFSNESPTLQMAGQRAYEFFTGTPAPRADQPVLALSAESTRPVPGWIVESIYGSRRRATKGPVEILHSQLTNLMSEEQVPLSVSIEVYKAFAAGYDILRKKSSESREVAWLEWEEAIRAKAHSTLLKSVRHYAGVTGEELDRVLFQ